MKSYAGVVCFVYFLQMLIALGFAIYLLFELIAPGVFGGAGNRHAILAELLDFAFIMVVSAFAVAMHSSLGPSIFPSGRTPKMMEPGAPAAPAAPAA